MDAVNAKLLSAVILFAVAFTCAWLPLKISTVNEELVTMGNAFSGGVLLSVALVHMLADAQDDLESLGNSINLRFGGDPDDAFPVGDALFIAGLLIMLSSQVVTQAFFGDSDGDEEDLLLDEFERPLSINGDVHPAYSGPENRQPLLSSPERKEALKDEKEEDGGIQVEACGPPMIPMLLCVSCAGKGQVARRDEHGCIVMQKCLKCKGTGKLANQTKAGASHTHSHDHGRHVPHDVQAPPGHEVVRVSYVPVDNQLAKIITVAPAQLCCMHQKGAPLHKLRQVHYNPPRNAVSVSEYQALASLVTLVALSIHSVLEGLAAGAAKNEATALSIVGAIACHKGFAAFALSSMLLPLRQREFRYRCDLWLLSTTWFALASPLAMLMGVLLERGLNSTSVAVVICTASGTLAFVGISEMLLPALRKASPGNSILKLLLAIAGASLMTFLAVWV